MVFILFFFKNGRLAVYWGLDCLALFAPHWVTGVRSFLRKDRLIIKIDLLEQIMEYLSSPSDVQVLPMLSTREAKEGGTIPVDARLMLRFLNAPEYFLGLQFRKEWRAAYESQHPNLTIEGDTSKGVDVLVIRQSTMANSGYYTNLKSARYIVDAGLDIVRKLLNNQAY